MTDGALRAASASAKENPGVSDGATGFAVAWNRDLIQSSGLVVWRMERMARLAEVAGGVGCGARNTPDVGGPFTSGVGDGVAGWVDFVCTRFSFCHTHCVGL